MSNPLLNLEMRRALHAAGIDPSSIKNERQLKAAIDKHNLDLEAGLAALRQPRMSTRRELSAAVDRLRAENLELRAASGRHPTPLADRLASLSGAEASLFYRTHRADLRAEDASAAEKNFEIHAKEAASRVIELQKPEPNETAPDHSNGQFSIPGSAQPVQRRGNR